MDKSFLVLFFKKELLPSFGVPMPWRSTLCALLVSTAAHAADKAVLIAGDGSLPVFDNALRGVSAYEPGAEILSATAQGAHAATLAHVLGAIASMHPARGQGCFVFATSHGARNDGVWLSVNDEYLTPDSLDRALDAGCGDAPTAVVISACFSGSFAQPPMARPNRVVLTAARADHTSFGCQAGRTYTVYDKCLLDALDAGGNWRRVYGFVKACVRAEEKRENVSASGPQGWFGRDVAALAPPQQSHQPQ
jgi:hypothetical protein